MPTNWRCSLPMIDFSPWSPPFCLFVLGFTHLAYALFSVNIFLHTTLVHSNSKNWHGRDMPFDMFFGPDEQLANASLGFIFRDLLCHWRLAYLPSNSSNYGMGPIADIPNTTKSSNASTTSRTEFEVSLSDVDPSMQLLPLVHGELSLRLFGCRGLKIVVGHKSTNRPLPLPRPLSSVFAWLPTPWHGLLLRSSEAVTSQLCRKNYSVFVPGTWRPWPWTDCVLSGPSRGSVIWVLGLQTINGWRSCTSNIGLQLLASMTWVLM